MSKRVQRLRHATAAADAFIGKDGEITVDSTKNTLRVHNGATPGGRETARDDLDNVNVADGSNAGKMSTAQAVRLNAVAGTSTASKALIMSSGNAINTININTNGLKLNGVVVAATAVELNLNDTMEAVVGGGKKFDAFEGTADTGSNPTVLLFHHNVAPTGWVKDTASTYNNAALRLVTSTSWSAADMTGSPFTTIFGASKNTGGSLSTNAIAHSHADTIAVANGGTHTHTVPTALTDGGSQSHVKNNTNGIFTSNVTTTGTGSHSHTITGGVTNNSASGSTHTHTMALDIDYVSMIRAVKA